jgi:hypothetical protein
MLSALLRLGLPRVSWRASMPAASFFFGGDEQDEVAFAVQQVHACSCRLSDWLRPGGRLSGCPEPLPHTRSGFLKEPRSQPPAKDALPPTPLAGAQVRATGRSCLAGARGPDRGLGPRAGGAGAGGAAYGAGPTADGCAGGVGGQGQREGGLVAPLWSGALSIQRRVEASPSWVTCGGAEGGSTEPSCVRLSAEEVSALTHVAVVTRLRGLKVTLTRLPE